MYLIFFFVFFSSRRRHTRYIGDWSSDVCSSDLVDDGESPADGDHDAPNTGAFIQQPERAGHQALHGAEGQEQADPPLFGRGLNGLQDDAGDFLGDGGVGETRRDYLIGTWVDGLFVEFRFQALTFLDLRVRIPQTAQISGAGPRIQFFQQTVVASLGFELRYTALGIVDIAEHDGLCRAGLRASGRDFAIGDAAVLLFGFNLDGVNALNAVGAFFHHAAAAYGDVRIADALEALCIPIRIQQEIEAPHLVRAVI